MEPNQALIGMSGGVDSSVAAWLMQQQGVECIGATMRLWDKNPDGSISKDTEDAKQVADRLGIRHCVLDYRKEFREEIIRAFTDSYEQGLTPNPCILCNKVMKFGLMLEAAREMGCRWVVSGHYANIRQDPQTGRYLLCKAADESKDQTYFLYRLSQEQLAHIRFPLGDFTKSMARDIAEANGLVTARKRDSQDICFIPGGDYVAFMEGYLQKHYAPGDFLDRDGNVVGTHRGAVCYTVGQRKGLGLAMGEPVYVCGKSMEDNTVTVGPNEVLFHNALEARDWNWISMEAPSSPVRVSAKIRHSRNEYPATVYPEADGRAKVVFDEAVRAISPGQAVVLYQGDTVVGGGTIVRAMDE